MKNKKMYGFPPALHGNHDLTLEDSRMIKHGKKMSADEQSEPLKKFELGGNFLSSSPHPLHACLSRITNDIKTKFRLSHLWGKIHK